MSRTYISPKLRRLIIERAENCCEYCLVSQTNNFLPFEIDHIIAEKHQGVTEKYNLCWSCSTCNGYKGSDIASYDPETEQLTPLYHPRRDTWHDHFELDGAHIIPKTAIGRVTVSILKLNETQRLQDRSGLIQLNTYPCDASANF